MYFKTAHFSIKFISAKVGCGLFPGLEYSFGKPSGVTKPYSDKVIEDEESSRPKIKGIRKIYLKRR